MSAIAFVESLFDSGRVRVGSALEPPVELRDGAILLDRRARMNLAFDPPELNLDVAEWALLAMYRACQALVYREIPGDAIQDALSRPCPGEPSPSVVYSADLALCFLPDLVKLARGIAQDDPLVVAAMALAKQWPLSSVGIADIGEMDISPFIDHPSLRRLYADRIIERVDISRMKHPPAAQAVREALGAHRLLSPKLAEALEPQL